MRTHARTHTLTHTHARTRTHAHIPQGCPWEASAGAPWGAAGGETSTLFSSSRGCTPTEQCGLTKYHSHLDLHTHGSRSLFGLSLCSLAQSLLPPSPSSARKHTRTEHSRVSLVPGLLCPLPYRRTHRTVNSHSSLPFAAVYRAHRSRGPPCFPGVCAYANGEENTNSERFLEECCHDAAYLVPPLTLHRKSWGNST